MKKLYGIVLAILVLVLPFSIVEAKKTTTTTTTTTLAKKEAGEKINVYIFYGSTCGYCASLHEFTAKLENDPEYNYMFNIVDFEVWGNSSNAALMQDVAKSFNTTANGVPFYVIGDEYFTGYAESYQSKIKDAIETAYFNAEYKDVVASLSSYKSATASTKESKKAEEDKKKQKNYAAYIVLGVTTVVIIGIIIVRSKEN